ncbi:NAD(P)H-binding protein [Flavobacterium agricola]|uniref:NAD(P)H-binding protein n=1 Tax=Flavobacterium agricola TaxID=2870839 RepID=A0ABY6M0A8_9FLAO|nr:NAD(P)H-binding protein [Flavobacterium agricola]UYW01919.1 NAD(P)H-binding protein [Flavobacterium agricola]
MKIAIIGATGFVGANLVNEFVARNHEVTAISRKEKTSEKPNLKYVAVDVLNVDALANVLKGNDVVVSAYNAGWQNPNIYNEFLAGSKAIQQAVKQAEVPRYVVIGGAGSLFVAEGIQAVDTPDFPKEIYAGASAARDYFNELKNETELDWVFFSPAFEMHPGITVGRTGNYRLGLDTPVFDADNRSVLSVEDVAVVIADEVEKPKHHKIRFTAAY